MRSAIVLLGALALVVTLPHAAQAAHLKASAAKEHASRALNPSYQMAELGGSCGIIPSGQNYVYLTCQNPQCCSSAGYCGVGDAWCGKGCQPLLGRCGGTVDPTPSPSSSPDPVTNGKLCGPLYGNAKCPAGQCCSSSGVCGTNNACCGTGCQDGYGDCDNNGGGSGGVVDGGQCGAWAGNAKCANSLCCSRVGYCGSSDAYCGSGCQAAYGNCGGGSTASSSSSKQPVTTDGGTPSPSRSSPASSSPNPTEIAPGGPCGPKNGGAKCGGSQCCSAAGFCGVGAPWCGTGCQSAYGKCNGVSASASSSKQPAATRTASASKPSSTTPSASKGASKSKPASTVSSSPKPTEIAPGGPCGPDNGGAKCGGSQCCSAAGFCGIGGLWCGSGCQPAYGNCGAATTPSSSPKASASSTPEPTEIAPGGPCGPDNGGAKCGGSQCCSAAGYCGVGAPWCGSGCQSPYGNCDNKVSSSSSPKPLTSASSSKAPVASASSSPNPTEIAPGGPCGPDNGGAKCGGSQCCSAAGYCGVGAPWCGTGCQSAYGNCDNKVSSSSSPKPVTSASASKAPVASASSSPNPTEIAPGGPCGPDNGGAKCGGSQCCSAAGYCGVGAPWCGSGCQSAYGNCDNKASPSSSPKPMTSASASKAPVPSSTPKPTEAQPGGPCGPDNGGAKCGGSQCCSAAGYCGVGDAWCGNGCQSAYGNCNNAAPSPSSSPVPNGNDGRCGAAYYGIKCTDGNCCSKEGYCGQGPEWCGASVCQVGYGNCDSAGKTKSCSPSPKVKKHKKLLRQ